VRASGKQHQGCGLLPCLGGNGKVQGSYGEEGNPAELWDWCLDRSQSQLLNFLAYAAANSVNAVETKFTDRRSAFAHANQLGEPSNLNADHGYRPGSHDVAAKRTCIIRMFTAVVQGH
jgi:hypothetical protein